MATCRQCAYLRKCIDNATKGGYEHNVDFDPQDGCPGLGFKSNTAADTNADRIRAMSDEELADLLTSANKGAITDICREMHYEHNLEWLKQPAEE